MITLHRLGGESTPFVLNSDLILTIEASPDTHITLVTGARMVVRETPEEVVTAVRDWSVGVARRAFADAPVGLHPV